MKMLPVSWELMPSKNYNNSGNHIDLYLTMDNWTQEKYYSCLMLAELYAGHPVSKNMTTSIKYLLTAGKYMSALFVALSTFVTG